MKRTSDILGSKIEAIIPEFLKNEPLIPQSIEIEDWSAHMGGKPIIVKGYDIAKHNNPHLVALAQAIITDPRFGDGRKTAVLMEALQTKLAEVLYTLAPKFREEELHQEIMTRVHYAIDFVMRSSAEKR